MKNAFMVVIVLSIASLSGCSASRSGSSGGSIIPPVQAQSGYSNASVTGTYAFSFGSRATQEGYIGTLIADGNGNITGTLNSQTYHAGACSVSIAGTYSVQSNGSGSLSWMLTPAGTSPCSATGTDISDITPQSFSMEVAQQGAYIALSGNNTYTFAAAKQ